MVRRRMLAPALALAAALVLPACAANAPTSVESTAPLPAGVTVHFTQLRSDVAVRQGQVTVTNDSDETLTLGAVRVVDPRFDEPAARVVEQRSRLAPGAAVDVRVQLTDAACDAPHEGEASVTLTYATGDAAPESEATLPLPDPLDVLGPLHERECRAQLLADAASVTFTAFTPSPPGSPAQLELEIAPTGEGAAVVEALRATNLLTFEATAGDVVGEFPIGVEVVPGDTETAVVAVPIVPFRCDPHAVQEDKRGTIFDVAVTVDGEPGEVELFVGEEMRGRILTWVAQWCGFGS